MIKVLIGDSNIQQDIQDFSFLKNNSDYQVITSTSGSETIAKCKETEPSIIILYSSFVDMNYTDVIDKISILPNEIDMCNLILKVNDPMDKLVLSNTSVIYKIFDNAKNDNIEDTVNILKSKFEIPRLTIKELKFLLVALGIPPYTNSANYLASVIFKCYYNPEYFYTLDNLYRVVAEEQGVSKEQIKNGIRHLLDSFNKLYETSSNLIDNNLYKKLFINEKGISSKHFIKNFVRYLQITKNKKSRNY